MFRVPFLPIATVTIVGLLCLPGSAAAQQVRLELKDGLVTLDATEATPAAILAEWARVGGTRIIDGDRVTGARVTLKLEGVPERQALDIVLRSAAGYIAAPRRAGDAGASQFERVVVMPVSVNAAAARRTPLPAAAPMPMADPTPVQMPDQQQQPEGIDDVQIDDGSAMEQPASSTDFDYANPQRYFAARAAQERAAQAAAEQGMAVEDNEAPVAPGNFTTGAVVSSPGLIPVPAAPQPPRGSQGAAPPQNPYGLPAGVDPGSANGPPMEPDRSKYLNPYAPTPVQPQDQQ
jgi:hypothetical protein